MAQHRQPQQDSQQTETKLFFMFLFEIHVIVDVKKVLNVLLVLVIK